MQPALHPFFALFAVATYAPALFAESPARTLLLAESYRDDSDGSPCWVSQKLEGMRVFWDERGLSVRETLNMPPEKAAAN